MSHIEIDLSTAQRISLENQLYNYLSHRGKEGVLTMIKGLGYIQIDTVSVIERAHHHTIWSRIPKYQQSWLDIMLAKDRSIFEFWGHAASFLPMEDYRFFLPRMKRFPETSPWEKNFWMKHHDLADAILQRIRDEGALGASDFEDTRKGLKQQGWWEWKPAKVVLELLMWKGELMVTERRNFQRIYDLTERILPSHIDTTMPSPLELGRFYVQRAIKAQGISSEWDIINHMHTRESASIKIALKDMLHSNELIPVHINGVSQIHYSKREIIESVNAVNKHPKELFLLSPFDNMVILRPRIKRLFNYDYTIECYVPVSKRKYGYWSLPMLWKGKFIGRIDLKADRQAMALMIRNLHLEEKIAITDELSKSLLKSLYNFMIFNRCSILQWDTEQPKKLIVKMKEIEIKSWEG
jgi:uncharacterized protein